MSLHFPTLRLAVVFTFPKMVALQPLLTRGDGVKQEHGSTANRQSTPAVIVCVAAALFLFMLPCFLGRCNRHFFARTALQEPARFVRLTRRALDAIPIIKYKAQPTSNQDQDPSQPPSDYTLSANRPSTSCSICTEDFEEGMKLRSLPCGHAFHPHCVDPWLLERAETCPMCRHNVSTPFTHHPSELPAQPSRTFTLAGRWALWRQRPRVKTLGRCTH
ncbi:hypothetical protein B0J13DRAFT_240260 [Dactylonectria estremocensis]|uniref:RING-type domain-containing protein n=1 Tax=Dactylonectria estremocensis TaxID=1079267 RepID=A0A9P9D8U9_9HYPO|nr:hypothetical protein B0J13DRAFT_240260 [Dactylonectria estremocensis]